jgi:hypothetical protein
MYWDGIIFEFVDKDAEGDFDDWHDDPNVVVTM